MTDLLVRGWGGESGILRNGGDPSNGEGGEGRVDTWLQTMLNYQCE